MRGLLAALLRHAAAAAAAGRAAVARGPLGAAAEAACDGLDAAIAEALSLLLARFGNLVRSLAPRLEALRAPLREELLLCLYECAARPSAPAPQTSNPAAAGSPAAAHARSGDGRGSPAGARGA